MKSINYKLINYKLINIFIVLLIMTSLVIPYINKVQGESTTISSITQTASGVEIQWSSVSGATGYEIYRTTKESIERVGSTADTSFTDTTIENLKLYQYEVVTIKDGVSYYSPATAFYTSDNVAPVLPTNKNIKVKPGSNYVDLSWVSSLSNDVRVYEIYRDGIKVGVSTTTSYRDSNGVSMGSSYVYTVKAVDYYNNVSESYTNVNVSTISIVGDQTVTKYGVFPTGFSSNSSKLVVGKPSILTAQGQNITENAILELDSAYAFEILENETNASNNVKINFDYSFNWGNKNNNNSNGQAYNLGIEYKAIGSSEWTTMATISNTATTNDVQFSDDINLSSGRYQLRFTMSVKTSNETSGNWAELEVDNLKVYVNNFAPSVPGNPEISLGATKKYLNLSWTASSDINLIGYRIYRDNTVIASTVNNSFTDSSFELKDSDAEYTYKIEAIDDRGLTAQTVGIPITVPSYEDDVMPPQAPGGGLVDKPTKISMNLTWEASPSPDIQKYIIFKNDGTKFSVIGVTTFTNFKFNKDDSYPAPYDFRVIAVDKDGEFSGATQIFSGSFSEADSTSPTKPTDFKATNITSSSVDLAWKLSTDNEGVERYEVEAEINGSGTWHLVNTIAHPKNSVSIKELLQNTNYKFRITAIDTSGNKSEVPHQVVNVKTLVDTSPPEVAFFKPSNQSIEVGRATNITAKFTDRMNVTTINSDSFFITQKGTSVKLAATYSTNQTAFILNPTVNLDANTEYEVTITTSAKNMAEMGLIEEFKWSFTTGEALYNKPHGSFADETGMCNNCHSGHEGKSTNLLTQDKILDLCIQCHDGTGSIYNVKGDFGNPAEKTSHHPVLSETINETDEQGNKFTMSCVSCHEPHNRGMDLDTGLSLTSEAKLLWSFNKGVKDIASDIYTVKPEASGSGNKFCWSCHGREGSPTYSYGYLDDGTFNKTVDYIGDHETNFPKNNKGHNSSKMDHYKSSHYIEGSEHKDSSPTNIKCSICHEKHASDIKPLLRGNISFENTTSSTATITNNGKEFCYQCHENAIDYTYSDWGSYGTAFNDYDGKEVNERSGHSQFDCQVCHNTHGSENPNYLRLNYAVGQSSSNTDVAAAICYDCHSKGNLTSVTTGPTITVNSETKSMHSYHFTKTPTATCKRCHRVHGAKDSENNGNLNHKIGFPVTNPGTYNRSENTATCNPSCHGDQPVANLRPITSPTDEQIKRSLHTNWETSSKILSDRRSLNLLQYRDSNNNGLLYK
ncbi:MAG: cytochrome family protein [Bacillales bacterium]|jgi:predicted CXXCH cytochrome family protein|nr:cytochrome family protein [Bacillales bacterium]